MVLKSVLIGALFLPTEKEVKNASDFEKTKKNCVLTIEKR